MREGRKREKKRRPKKKRRREENRRETKERKKRKVRTLYLSFFSFNSCKSLGMGRIAYS